jgi:hypothetical protein
VKKFSDAITVIAFFAILLMFAVSTLFFQGKVSFENISKNSDTPKEACTEYVVQNFPLNSNWRSMFGNLMGFVGKKRFGDTFIAGDRLVKVSDNHGDDNTIENVAYINELAANTESPIYMMLAPTAGGVYSADLPGLLGCGDQRERINDAYMQLDKRIISIDAFYPLYSARDEYVYYRTEDLWTSFGAYYAYTESVRQLGFPAVSLDNYDQEYADANLTGSLYDKAMVGSIEPDRINIFRSKYQSPVTKVKMYGTSDSKEAESVYFRSALKSGKKTDIFLLGNRYIRTDVFTNLKESPKLLIIKGSYANTIVPFYTAHYSKITMVDPNRMKQADMKLSDVVDPDDYDQILVIFDIDSFSNAAYFDTLT